VTDEVPDRPRNELRGAARLLGEAVGLIARPIERTQRHVVERITTSLGPVGEPVRRGHDAIASLSYRAVGITSTLVGEAVATAASVAGRPRDPLLDRSPVGSGVVAAINGLLGDRLAASSNDLEIGLTLRHHDADLPVRTDALRSAYPRAGDHLVLLVPGLGETEHAWRFRRSRRAPIVPDYGSRLAAELGICPLYLRYNTGQPLVTSAARLSELLENIVVSWPVPVRRIDLVGHSMGGIVIRLAAAVSADARWSRLVGHMVYLGSPHAGAALAQGAGALARLLTARTGSRAWGELLDLRSAGIKDLGAGVGSAPATPLAHAKHHTVIAELTNSERHPVARLLGDVLVSSGSAQLEVGDRLRIARAHHLDLLNHAEVYEALLRWLGDRSEISRTPP